jgi:hypothetical protein
MAGASEASYTSVGAFIATTNYVCIDMFSGPALLEYGRAFGLDTLSISISMLEAVNSLLSVVRRLNLAIKYHAIFVLGGVLDKAWLYLGMAAADLDPEIPDYDWYYDLDRELFQDFNQCPEADE